MNEEDDLYIALLAVALFSVAGLGVYIYRQRGIRELPETVRDEAPGP
jgi:hypothetical protein